MTWPLVGLAGGMVGLDATSFPQIMISRPLVAGALAGWALGDPGAGLTLGALHEVFNLSILPVGAARYPEAGTATVAATAALLTAGPVGWSSMLVALAFALVWEQAAGRSVVLFRHGVERLMLTADGPLATDTLERRHTLAILLDFLRASAVAIVGGLLGSVLLGWIVPRVALPDEAIRTGIAIAAGAALGGSLGLFGGWTERWRSVTLGVAAGCLLVLLR